MSASERWSDIVMPRRESQLTAEEIADGVIERMGLGVKNDGPS